MQLYYDLNNMAYLHISLPQKWNIALSGCSSGYSYSRLTIDEKFCLFSNKNQFNILIKINN